MDNKKLIEALRLCVYKEDHFESCTTGQPDCPFGETCIDCEQRMKTAAADRIEKLTAQLAEQEKQLAAMEKDLIDCGYQDGSICSYCAKDGSCDVEADEYRRNCGACFEWRGPQEAGEVEHG